MDANFEGLPLSLKLDACRLQHGTNFEQLASAQCLLKTGQLLITEALFTGKLQAKFICW